MSRSRFLLNAGLAAFIAILLAGPGAAIFPGTFAWASWVACPRGTAPMTDEYAARHHTDETDGRFWCVAPDGTGHERTIAAMGGLFLMYFMGISVLLSILSVRAAHAHDGAGASTPRAPVRASPASPSSAALTHIVPAEAGRAARELLAAGRKIHAIRVVREASGLGLKEAKEWVERLPATASFSEKPAPAPAAPAGIVPADAEAAARELFAAGQTIQAVKVVRDATGMGLTEAKYWVETLPARPQTPLAGSTSAPGTAAARLAELKRLLDARLITIEDFERKKDQILTEL